MNHKTNFLLFFLRFLLTIFPLFTLSCKFQKPQTEIKQDTSGRGTQILESDIITTHGSVSKMINSTDNLESVFTLKAGNTSNEQLVTLDFSMYASSTNASGSNSVAAPKVSVLKVTPLGTKNLVDGQELSFKNLALSAKADFTLVKGDQIVLRLSNLPDSAVGGYFSANATLNNFEGETSSDNLANGHYLATKYFRQDKSEIEFSREVKLRHSQRLFSVEATVLVHTLSPSKFSVKGTNSQHDCSDFKLAGNAELQLTTSSSASNVSGTGTVFALPALPSPVADCELYFKGSVVAGLPSTQALKLSAKVTGIDGSNQIVTTLLSLNAEPEEDTSAASPIGSNPISVPVSKPNLTDFTTTTGILSEAGQQVLFRFPVSTPDAGLKVTASLNLFYPLNDGGKALQSTFDGSAGQPTIEANLVDSRGNPFVDSSGQPIQGPAQVASSRDYVSWESVGYFDLPRGDVFLELRMPKSLADGTFVVFRVAGSEVKDLVPQLNTTQLSALKTKQKGTVHEWPTPDYSKSAAPLREGLAMYDVLQAMEEIRDTFHLTTNLQNPFTGNQVQTTALNNIDLGTIEACLGNNDAPHWSDITHHYYCLLNAMRSCYSGGIRGTAGAMQSAQQNVMSQTSDPAQIEAKMLFLCSKRGRL
jgi:hypothetical protein